MDRKHSPPHSVQERKLLIFTVWIRKVPHNVTAKKRKFVPKNGSNIL